MCVSFEHQIGQTRVLAQIILFKHISIISSTPKQNQKWHYRPIKFLIQNMNIFISIVSAMYSFTSKENKACPLFSRLPSHDVQRATHPWINPHRFYVGLSPLKIPGRRERIFIHCVLSASFRFCHTDFYNYLSDIRGKCFPLRTFYKHFQM